MATKMDSNYVKYCSNMNAGFSSTLVRPRGRLPRQQHFKGTPDYASARMLLCEPTLYIDDLGVQLRIIGDMSLASP